jgi:hypothetical protein
MRLVSTAYNLLSVTKWLINLIIIWPFLVVDQLLNTITGGSPRETISGRLARHNSGRISKHIYRFLNWIDPNHCEYWEAPNAENEEVFNPWEW